MSKRQLLMILGLWLITFLFLGFPSSWDRGLAIVSGVVIFVIAWKMRPPEPKEEALSDNLPFIEHRSSEQPVHNPEQPVQDPPVQIQGINNSDTPLT
jgi:hypothetical protein